MVNLPLAQVPEILQGNFTAPPPGQEFDAEPFDMNQSVPIIMRLLEIDGNLARMHAKLSPKMDETSFWRNYFLRVAYLRAADGMDGPTRQRSLGALPVEKVICRGAEYGDRKPREQVEVMCSLCRRIRFPSVSVKRSKI